MQKDFIHHIQNLESADVGGRFYLCQCIDDKLPND